MFLALTEFYPFDLSYYHSLLSKLVQGPSNAAHWENSVAHTFMTAKMACYALARLFP